MKVQEVSSRTDAERLETYTPSSSLKDEINLDEDSGIDLDEMDLENEMESDKF
ncbi:MAG: hypothetical protein HC902_03005 [Calothrix sp. SM1_5_4]|nr:hypothetical protein [Calothrix sp. SM1_5_4]